MWWWCVWGFFKVLLCPFKKKSFLVMLYFFFLNHFLVHLLWTLKCISLRHLPAGSVSVDSFLVKTYDRIHSQCKSLSWSAQTPTSTNGNIVCQVRVECVMEIGSTLWCWIFRFIWADLTVYTSQQMHSPLFFVKVCVMSSRAGLIIGAPVNAMHWGLLGGKKRLYLIGWCTYSE